MFLAPTGAREEGILDLCPSVRVSVCVSVCVLYAIEHSEWLLKSFCSSLEIQGGQASKQTGRQSGKQASSEESS